MFLTPSPSRDLYPALQRQVVCLLNPFVVEPSGQGLHDDEPAVELYVSLLQLLQSLDPVVLYDPAGQRVHSVLLATDLEPAKQSVQLLLPIPEKLPSGQSIQMEEPTGEYNPPAHFEQVSLPVTLPPLHSHPPSTVQVEEHPSPFSELESSQPSFGDFRPSPHIGWHAERDVDPETA